MGEADALPVTFGRWQAAQQALEARVAALEAAASRRRDRSWTLVLAVLSGLALPAILLGLGILINRAGG